MRRGAGDSTKTAWGNLCNTDWYELFFPPLWISHVHGAFWLFVPQGNAWSSGTEEKFAGSAFSILYSFCQEITWKLNLDLFQPLHFSLLLPFFLSHSKAIAMYLNGQMLPQELGINLVAEMKNGKVLQNFSLIYGMKDLTALFSIVYLSYSEFLRLFFSFLLYSYSSASAEYLFEHALEKRVCVKVVISIVFS